VLLGMAGVVVAVGGMRAVADLLGPVFLALMLTVTVSPLTGWLSRRGTPSWLATAATATTVYLILVALGGALVASLARLVDLMPAYSNKFNELQADLSSALAGLGVDAAQIRDVVSHTEPSVIAGLIPALLGGVAGALSNAIFLLAVLLFMSLDAAHFPDRLLAASAERPHVVEALRSFASGTRRYLLVSTVFGLIVAVIDTLLLWALGIPLPVLWGLLAFITNYIPNIGFLIGLVPPALLGLLEGGVPLMVAVIAVYSVVNFVIQSVIQPKIVGDAVGLSTTVSFLSLVFWGWVLGPLGALLAIPLSLLAKGLLVDIDPATRWIDPLISGGRR
jgi:AI-2 transport protein TqsA